MTMKRIGWLTLGLALTMAGDRPAAAPQRPAPPGGTPPAFGVGPAYERFGQLAVMHEGRIKPIDTLAREEIKQIFGRETVKLLDAENKVSATWGPVGALYDWSVRPKYWDEQPIILVEYLPLKRLILAGTVQAELSAIADRESTTAADRAGLKKLLADPELSSHDMAAFLAEAKLPAE